MNTFWIYIRSYEFFEELSFAFIYWSFSFHIFVQIWIWIIFNTSINIAFIFNFWILVAKPWFILISKIIKHSKTKIKQNTLVLFNFSLLSCLSLLFWILISFELVELLYSFGVEFIIEDLLLWELCLLKQSPHNSLFSDQTENLIHLIQLSGVWVSWISMLFGCSKVHR